MPVSRAITFAVAALLLSACTDSRAGVTQPPPTEPVSTLPPVSVLEGVLVPSPSLITPTLAPVSSSPPLAAPRSVPDSSAPPVIPSAPSSTAPAPPSSSNATSPYVPVTKVVDGDTFDVLLDGKTERVRLIGIDTPETVDPRKPVQCFGIEASNTAKTLLSGKRVRLERDPTQDDRDVYGRVLRYAYVEDGPFFNQYMIAEGYAHEYTYEIPYQFQQAFRDAERAARESGRGLWADDACPLSVASAAPVLSAPPSRTTVGAAGADGHAWYASSYRTAKYYYCDTDPGWQELSARYLTTFDTEAALKEKLPGLTLHAPCE